MKISELEILTPYVWREGLKQVHFTKDTAECSTVFKRLDYALPTIDSGAAFMITEEPQLVSTRSGHYVLLKIIGVNSMLMGWVMINATAMNPNRKPARLKIEPFKKPYDGPKT